MTYSWHKLAKAFFTLAVIGSLLPGFLGISHFRMTMGPDGEMSIVDCPFMNGGSICTMTALEHVAMWQSIFTSTPHELNQSIALLLLLVSLFGIIWIRRLYPPPRDVLEQYKYYLYYEHIPVLTVLQELFSSGILNQKPF